MNATHLTILHQLTTGPKTGQELVDGAEGSLQRRQQHEEAERRRAEGEARATEAALPTLAERRAKVAERYRDDKTGACLTCQATAECSGYTKLICRWCEEAEEASEVERDDATEDE